jgi:Zn-dependent M16 (insulinase) family peptidase
MSSRLLILAVFLVTAACSPRKPAVQPVPAPTTPAAPLLLEELAEGSSGHDFRAVALYLGDADAPMGARFVHGPTGFVFDYLRIESAPQGFLWVNTFPTSDKGEPHTQEHLLLGKGARGRWFGSVQTMSLADSSAFTMQWRTCYHFHTVAAHPVFWPVFENQLETLLEPDYTDEEIRREVRHFGVDQGEDGKLALEEKGTVYQEMVSTYERPSSQLWRTLSHLVYGRSHPLAWISGGYPDDIRLMTPEDIRSFHRAHYYLGNMGMVGAFPGSMALDEVLASTAAILARHGGHSGHAMTEADLPAPAGASAGALAVVPYPQADASKASPVALVWPATRRLELAERTLLSLFLSAFAGDESTNLYKRIVDRKTRTLDVDATAVWSHVSSDQGQPVFIGLEGVAARALDEASLAEIRKTVQDELGRVARLAPGDPELVALNQRVQSRLTDLERRLAKFLSSPPGFGFRGTGASWMQQLRDLEGTPGFRKSLTRKADLARLKALVAGADNPWTERLAAWGLFETPYGVAARPSPEERKALDDAQKARVAAELARLSRVYGLEGDAAVLGRFRADYDAASAAMEAASTKMPPFVKSPPLTLDDDLRYEVTRAGEVPIVASRIDSMPSSTVGLAFRLDAVPEAQLPYLAMLPALLTESGLFIDGKALPSDEVKEALRREILSLSSWYESNARTGRVELVVEGSGNNLAETRRALGWMAKVMAHPDLRVENLPRLRDVVDQRLTGLRNVMMRSEESWVDDPAGFYRRQGWPLFAHTESFLTRLHDVHRLRWMLSDPGDPAVSKQVARFLGELAAAKKLGRSQREALARALVDASPKPDPALAPYLASLAALPAPARALVAQAGKDLGATLGDLPEASLADDWAYLCRQMATDLERGASVVLAELDAVRRAIVQAGNARGWLVGSSADGDALAPELDALVAGLGHDVPHRKAYSERPLVLERLRARGAITGEPRFVGLLNPSTSSGVFLHSAPAASYFDASEPALLDHLAANLFSGHAGHGLFMKTWAAGLAYSNGIRVSAEQGRIRYYAERCPELPQTMRFVIDELRRARPDAELSDYAIAQAFSSRVAASYEHRARSIADDLTDGVTPEVVRAFRQGLLALRGRENLASVLFERLPRVYGSVLPGYGPRTDSTDAVYFVIGPEAQLEAWERHLKTIEGEETRVVRLYPRDFWVPADVR